MIAKSTYYVRAVAVVSRKSKRLPKLNVCATKRNLMQVEQAGARKNVEVDETPVDLLATSTWTTPAEGET